MKRAEFNRLLGIAKTLQGEARRKMMESLNGVEIDDGGVITVAKVIDEAGDSGDVDLDPIIDSAISKRLGEIQNTPMGGRPMITQPSSKAYFGGIKAQGSTNYLKGPDAREKAYRWGAWGLAVLGKSASARDWCENNGLVIKSAGQVEGSNELGGFLVPEILESDLIDLRKEYGSFRRNAYVRPMTSDTSKRPRRTGGLTAYFAGEGQSGTKSKKKWDAVALVAKKLIVLSKISSELNEDAIINVGDDLAGEASYAFAYKEDLCGFNGDGTSAYGGIVGVVTKLTTLNGVDDGAGIVLGSGNLWSELILKDFHRTVGRVPSFARMGSKWHCSPTFFDTVMSPLITAAGGATANDIINGTQGRGFLGYPVDLTEVLPETEANSQVCCLFGNLQKAATLGDRRGVTITFSESAVIEGESTFEQDEVAFRATERFDINVHDVGTATEAGPIVGLITAAS